MHQKGNGQTVQFTKASALHWSCFQVPSVT